jgi:hypothetical protein
MDIQSSIQHLQLKLFPLGVPYDVVPTALQSLELEEVPARYYGTSPLEKTYKQVTPYFNKGKFSTGHRYFWRLLKHIVQLCLCQNTPHA